MLKADADRVDLESRLARVYPFAGNGGSWREAVIAAYDALMNGNGNQSRLHIPPGTSSARPPALV
jgi:hypothetical protein